MWLFTIEKEELLKALADIDEAEKNGFMFCTPCFEISEMGFSLSDYKAKYSDLIEKAHPTNGNFNWGRHQDVSKHNIFIDGELFKKDTPPNT